MQKQLTLLFFCISTFSFAQSDCFRNCAQRAETHWQQLKARGITSTDSALQINHTILEGLKGCEFPKTTLNNFAGGTFTIDQFKGNVVFVHFWFTTCATCIAEMPSIQKLEEEFKTQPVKFLNITFNKKEVLDAFFKKHPNKYSSQAYLDQKVLESDFCILDGYPLNMVLDKNGKVIDAWYEENPEPDKQEPFYEKALKTIKRGLNQ